MLIVYGICGDCIGRCFVLWETLFAAIFRDIDQAAREKSVASDSK